MISIDRRLLAPRKGSRGSFSSCARAEGAQRPMRVQRWGRQPSSAAVDALGPRYSGGRGARGRGLRGGAYLPPRGRAEPPGGALPRAGPRRGLRLAPVGRRRRAPHSAAVRLRGVGLQLPSVAPQSHSRAPAGRRRRWPPEQARVGAAGGRAPGSAGGGRVAAPLSRRRRARPRGPGRKSRRAPGAPGRSGRTMSDIRHSLLRRDALSAAKEVLYHLDIYFSSQLQSAPLPIVDKGPVELLEEFVFQVPKERGAQPKVRRAAGMPASARRKLPLLFRPSR